MWRISIHAPTRGATLSGRIVNLMEIHFNPRSYKRSDGMPTFHWCPTLDFNPRSYKRSDLPLPALKNIRLIFQSTLLQEERPYRNKANAIALQISIHAPTRGATCTMPIMRWAEMISIHAPTRGATSTRMIVTPAAVISIHAPTRGATQMESQFQKLARISIHAPTRGATVMPDNFCRNTDYFNPRSYKRSDKRHP